MEKNEVIVKLLKDGGKKVNNLVVKNITITPQERYIRVALTLDKKIEGYVQNVETGVFEKGETNIIFVSLYSIVSVLKDNDVACIIAPQVLENPKALNIVLSRAKINIIQESISAGVEYVNPWSNNAEPTTFDHDAIINHIIDIEPSEYAISKIDKYAENLLGF